MNCKLFFKLFFSTRNLFDHSRRRAKPDGLAEDATQQSARQAVRGHRHSAHSGFEELAEAGTAERHPELRRVSIFTNIRCGKIFILKILLKICRFQANINLYNVDVPLRA
jgi:hypothetical protein